MNLQEKLEEKMKDIRRQQMDLMKQQQFLSEHKFEIEAKVAHQKEQLLSKMIMEIEYACGLPMTPFPKS